MTKSEQIKQTLQETKERRKSQSCKVYTCKFDFSHLSKAKKEHLNMLFVEAKWLRNHLIEEDRLFETNTNSNTVRVLNKDKESEEREIKHLSAQMKQNVLEQIKSDIRGISAGKRKGRKVGRLKYKSRVNVIGLKQYDCTYRIVGKNYLMLQGLKKQLKVQGLQQIPDNAEFANAKLLRKPSGFYIAFTTFLPKEERVKTGKEIGLDFGIQTHITDSEGNKFKWEFKESKRHKKTQRKVNKTFKRGTKSSQKRNKRKHICRVEHERLCNRKKDAINKFVSKMKNDYDVIAIQNENISGWKSSKLKGFGRSVQYSIMGGIISGIKKLPQTTVIDRFEVTTQECLLCGKRTNHALADRIFCCSWCGHVEDRDVHSAKVILKKSKTICGGPTNTMPVETLTPTCLVSNNRISKLSQRNRKPYALA